MSETSIPAIGALVAAQSTLSQAGIRRVLAISGDREWCIKQARTLRQALPGDWLWVGNTVSESVMAPSQLKGKLGQEFLHAVFDAHEGLDAEALAILAGTLKAGSWLLLLVPDWEAWPHSPDTDSLRWSESAAPIATPAFIRRLREALLSDGEAVVWRQSMPLAMTPLRARPAWHAPDGRPTPRQLDILQQLRAARHAAYVITAPRGRGKSTVAGLFAQQCRERCWVVAPSRAASDVLLRQSGDATSFWSPDSLLAHCRQHSGGAEWLLIDEAAAIPSSVLNEMLSYFPHVLMTTTVLGYEGTGRGFWLKFCAGLPDCQMLELSEPLRWAIDDPLERLLDRVMLFQAENRLERQRSTAPVTLVSDEPAGWTRFSARLEQCYGLLCSAHYRTSPLDLRRLLDAPGMHLVTARSDESLCGVIWSVDEGGLNAGLARDVWAGRRRPRGNLVAQSLAAHGNLWTAPQLRSRRISRIAVLPSARREGIGQALVREQQRQSEQEGMDFLSVSFGYEPALWRFWQHCGFCLARIGSHIEASSGCYSAMALLPLSDAGKTMAQEAARQLARDWRWLRRDIGLMLDIELDDDSSLDEADWLNLCGFAFAHRSPQASLASLCRLLAHTSLALPALRLWLDEGAQESQSVERLGLSGKKSLLRRWREETAEALSHCDNDALQRARQWLA
ncbi:tRNA(Met) cytidine acetyltransferase TmcA [Lonsdalea populi]|uniref:tRNA(Met) cytidine acetyltransferase TmcA n=2 Tax=Lonsdalea populi TaxID=1172565 RepID=UPI001F0BFE85|nr:GNAT family N-acetyltransferase [Lonsdalea populi]